MLSASRFTTGMTASVLLILDVAYEQLAASHLLAICIVVSLI
jgi:hypothetical protein